MAEFEIWARRINRCGGKFYGVTSCLSSTMSTPSSLHAFIAPETQGADAAAATAPDIEVTLLAEEQQAQRDTDDLVKALEEANRKRDDLVNKRRDAQVAREKCEADQHEVDVKVRGRLLANAEIGRAHV